MKTNALTIDEEYKKIISSTEHEHICILGDCEDYNILREYIINHPKIHFQKHKLPFQDISLENKNGVDQLQQDKNSLMRFKSNVLISKEVCSVLSTIIFALRNYKSCAPLNG